MERLRLTTDNPQKNSDMQMNYAYAKDFQVVLRYAGGEEDVPLTEYIAKCAKEKGCELVTPHAVLFGDSCCECDCPLAVLNVVAIQAAELRSRLKEYEDAEDALRKEQGND